MLLLHKQERNGRGGVGLGWVGLGLLLSLGVEFDHPGGSTTEDFLRPRDEPKLDTNHDRI